MEAGGMKWFVRSALVAALPFILLWAFSAELFRGIKSAFWYAWQETRIECDQFRQLWRSSGA